MADEENYPTSLHHVLAELARLDLYLRVQGWGVGQCGGTPEEGLSAFYIPESEVDALLDKPVGVAAWAAHPLVTPIAEDVAAQLEQLGAEIADRVAGRDRKSTRLNSQSHSFISY